MTNKKYYIWAAVVIVIVLVLWLLVRMLGGSAPGSSGITPGAQTGSSGVLSPASPTSPTAKVTITSPMANDQWVFQVQHTIQWNRPAGSPGAISLVDATTGNVVGWIQQQILAGQSNFPWNTRDIFTSKTSPVKKDVAPGQYRIAISFISPNDPPVTGPVFSIITAAEAKVPTSTVVIQSALFSPSSLTVTHGTQLTFVNRDAVSYRLSNSSNGTPLTVGTSSSQTFDTSSLSPGGYVFYSTSFPSLRVTVTVK